MAEEFKTSQNTEEEEVLVNLTLDPEEDPAPQEDLSVNGEHKSHKKKKKKSNALYTVIIIVLLGVMGYSGYQIASTLLRDKEADDLYEDIENQFLIEDGTDLPEWTEPEQPEPSSGEIAPVETRETGGAEQPSQTAETVETEATAPIYTVEADPETTAPPATAPKTTASASSQNPLRLLNVNFTSLKKANKDAVAWIQGMRGVISYPVVQGKDNAYYLTHLFDGTKNANGTVFVHCENNFLQDDITYIFGHHMRSGKMFGRLTDYESRSYFNNNPEFRLYTPGKVYTLKIYAVFRGTGAERITLNYASAEAFNKAMQSYAARSMHPVTVPVSYGDKMVCLCTCSRHIEDGRFFVYCKIIDPG